MFNQISTESTRAGPSILKTFLFIMLYTPPVFTPNLSVIACSHPLPFLIWSFWLLIHLNCTFQTLNFIELVQTYWKLCIVFIYWFDYFSRVRRFVMDINESPPICKVWIYQCFNEALLRQHLSYNPHSCAQNAENVVSQWKFSEKNANQNNGFVQK